MNMPPAILLNLFAPTSAVKTPAFSRWRASSWLSFAPLCLAIAMELALGLLPAHAGNAGGVADGGFTGSYYSTPDFNAANLKFTRRDVRLDFNWGTLYKPGGSLDPDFQALGHDNFSVIWTGSVIPRFTESYTFKVFADDAVKVEFRPAGGAWATKIDQTSYTGADATFSESVVGGQRYELRISYKQLTGGASLRLRWTCPSLNSQEEVVDPIHMLGVFNVINTYEQNGYADIVKNARYYWEGIATDSNNWPMANGKLIMLEGIGQKASPLTIGTYKFRFKGKADISGVQNLVMDAYGTTGAGYSSGTFRIDGPVVLGDANLIQFTIANSDRDGQSPARNNGITELQIQRPLETMDALGGEVTSVSSTASYPWGSIFAKSFLSEYAPTTHIRNFYGQAGQQITWAERTPPTLSEQAFGRPRDRIYWQRIPGYNANYKMGDGPSIEYMIMLSNATGKDLYICWPNHANDDYLTQMAQVIRFGSDSNGVPRTSDSDPRPVYFPPLNSNLCVLLEMSNEMWNWAGAYPTYHDSRYLADDLLAGSNPAMLSFLNYDGTATERNLTAVRWQAKRIKDCADLFRSVFGESNQDVRAGGRVRALAEWQYGYNDSLTFCQFWDDVYNKRHASSPFTETARPVSFWLYGGGQAGYIGANPGYEFGETNPVVVADASFEATAVSGKVVKTGQVGPWTFGGTTGNAGLYSAGAINNWLTAPNTPMVAPQYGTQAAWIIGDGTITQTVNFPTAGQYAVEAWMKAVGLDNGEWTCPANIDVYLDYGTPSQQKLTLYAIGHPNQGFNWSTGLTEPFTKQSPVSFVATAGNHTITYKGNGVAGHMLFLDSVRVTSADAIGANYPGNKSGADMGGYTGTAFHPEEAVNVSNSYGFQQFGYEGGYALGGDTHGSPMTNWFRLYDDRSRQGTLAAVQNWFEFGCRGYTFTSGVYCPWASSFSNWYELSAMDPAGLSKQHVAVTDFMAMPYVEPFRGCIQGPAIVSGGAFSSKSSTSNKLDPYAAKDGSLSGRQWISWNVYLPNSASCYVGIDSTSGGTVELSVDDQVIYSGASGQPILSAGGTRWITKGVHSVKARLLTGACTVNQVQVSIVGAPDAPTPSTITESDGAATVNWTAPPSGPTVTGYKVFYGTTPGIYTHSLDVGTATSASLSGLENGKVYYVVVRSYGANGLSIASAERSIVPRTDTSSWLPFTVDFEELPLNAHGVSYFAAADGTWTTAPASGFSFKPNYVLTTWSGYQPYPWGAESYGHILMADGSKTYQQWSWGLGGQYRMKEETGQKFELKSFKFVGGRGLPDGYTVKVNGYNANDELVMTETFTHASGVTSSVFQLDANNRLRQCAYVQFIPDWSGAIDDIQVAVEPDTTGQTTIDFESLPLNTHGTNYWAAPDSTWVADPASGFSFTPFYHDIPQWGGYQPYPWGAEYYGHILLAGGSKTYQQWSWGVGGQYYVKESAGQTFHLNSFRFIGGRDAANGSAVTVTAYDVSGAVLYTEVFTHDPASTDSTFAPSSGNQAIAVSKLLFAPAWSGAIDDIGVTRETGGDPGTVPVITTTLLPDGVIGTAYSQQLQATGGDGALTWSLASGSLPAGLTLSGAGLISGTPTAAGLASFSASVSDIQNDTATQPLTLSIMDKVAAPAFSPAGGTYGIAQVVSLSCATAGATIRYTLDGSTPSSTNGTDYSAPISVPGTLTINAIGMKSGMADSPLASAIYTINEVWSGVQIGTVTKTGSSTYNGTTDTFTIKGAGIMNTTSSDSVYFVKLVGGVTGNCTMVAKVVSVQNTNANAKAGVMFRETTATNSKYAASAATGSASNTHRFQRRTTAGAAATSTNASSVAVPVWVKLVRSGNSLSAFRSTNGTTWTQTGTTSTVTMTSAVELGLFVASGKTNTLCQTVISDVAVTRP